MRDPQRIADLVQQAICNALDPAFSDPWNPEVEPSLTFHCMRLLDNATRGDRRRAAVRRSDGHVSKAREAVHPPQPTPEARALEADERAQAARICDMAAARLERDFDKKVLALVREGVDRPAEIAEALDASVDDVVLARGRIDYAIEAAAAEYKRDRARAALARKRAAP